MSRNPLWQRFALLSVLCVSLCAQQTTSLPPGVLEHIQAGLKARQEARLDDEVREFQAVVELAPNLAEAHMNLGLALRKQGHRGQAIESLKAAVRLKPGLGAALAVLGFESLTIGRLPEALDQLEAAHRASPNDASVNAWLGMAYLELDRYQEAVTHLEVARQAKPEDPDILFHLAVAHDAAAEAAREDLSQAAGDSARAHQASAEHAAASGWHDQALEEYHKAVELDPDLAGLQAALGDLYAATAQFAAAEKAYLAELMTRPEHARVRFQCGEVILKQGRPEEAFPYLDRALEQDAALVEDYFQLGKSLAQDGKFDLAEKTFLQLTEKELPLQAKILAHHQLAEVYKTQGNRKEASRHQKTFQRLTRDLEKAQKEAAEEKGK